LAAQIFGRPRVNVTFNVVKSVGKVTNIGGLWVEPTLLCACVGSSR